MTWVEEGAEQGYEVTAPSGATFQVISPEEVRFFEDIAARYQSDNHFCVPGDVLIAGPCGPRTALEISEGDVVWSIEASTEQSIDSLVVHPRRLVRGVVTKKVAVPAAPVFEIRTQNRTLRCSGTHPVLAWVVRPPIGKRVGRNNRPNRYQYEWVPAAKLRLMDRIIVQQGSPDEPIDWIGDRLMDESFMEFCGLFTGDGLVNTEKYVRISRQRGVSYIDHYQSILERLTGKKVYIPPSDTYIEVGSKSLADELGALGLLGGSLGKRVPSWVFGTSRKLRLAYLRGYLDSDGSVTELGRLQFRSPNHVLIGDVRQLCLDLAIPVTNLYVKWAKTTLPDGKERAGWVTGFVCSDARSNRDIWTHDVRYQERLLKNKGFNPSYYQYKDRYGRGLEPPEDCGFASVTMIVEHPPEVLYDIQVDGYESFVADGVVVHNSNVTDLMDLDRLLVKEVMCWRWGRWLSQEHDYEGQPVDLDALAKAQGEFSKEIRLLKKAMGLEKAARDRERGESIPDYIENLRRRAKEFGVMREDQLIKCITLFQELKALTTLYLNCDDTERREQNIEMSDLVDWVIKVAIPEFDAIDAYFTEHQQRYWLRSL